MKKILFICLLTIAHLVPNNTQCINLFRDKNQVNAAWLTSSVCVGLISVLTYKYFSDNRSHHYVNLNKTAISDIAEAVIYGSSISLLYGITYGLIFKVVADNFLTGNHPEEILYNIEYDLKKLDKNLLEIIKLQTKCDLLDGIEYEHDYWYGVVPCLPRFLGCRSLKFLQLKLAGYKIHLNKAKYDEKCTPEVEFKIDIVLDKINAYLNHTRKAIKTIQSS